MIKTAKIVVGLGFGDEGKGLVSVYYCRKANRPIVVRFNGGQQAGHTVYLKNGLRHVFSNLGVGSYRGIPTYWSRYCTFCPGFFLEEIKELGRKIEFYIDEACPVTTHYDILYNKLVQTPDGIRRHNSCGLGVSPTFQRHNDLSTKLTVKDLLEPSMVVEKLRTIKLYYQSKIQIETQYLFSAFNHDEEDRNFGSILRDFKKEVQCRTVQIVPESQVFNSSNAWHEYIFEGAQGILLDQTFGQNPFVTSSNTTSNNAVEIIRRNLSASKVNVQVSYVTRGYLTRHGDGPFKTGRPRIELKNDEHESNRFNEFQGKFKVGYLDLDLMNYALKCDSVFSGNYPKNLFVTCLDQIDHNKIPVFIDGRRRVLNFRQISEFLNIHINELHYSFSPFAEDLE